MAFDFGESKPSDPTADFLAREREAAGVLSGDADLFGSSNAAGAGASADDFERSASAFPALDDDLAPAAAAPSSNNAGASSGFGFDDFEDRPAAKPAADDEVGKFQQNFPELDDGPSANGNGASYHDDADDLMSAPSAPARAAPTSSAPTAQPTYSYSYEEPTEEPEAVRQWRETQKDAIAKRDAEGERKKAEAISKAEQDIDHFYAEYNAKKEKNIAANKENEAKFQEERTRELAEGTTWDRVTKLVDLKNSQSKTIARAGPGSSDLSRMKEVYLKLRREGERAPGAAGY
ncbi:Clathrin light chain [Kalmanozyma brasiliensis GHG001]|uniref:Clathrin light chain n=1 Tax=Kalmanozyma brasiliensis (strain GHG001) TaxID=1365824 RepID=V5GJI1_KALBG|nr:Clathrin light chain [Kalmanozyma brasiliensis GHG001]EST06107.1 Clathrin light chain [Kalmanozyma brasiliensis GHG001]